MSQSTKNTPSPTVKIAIAIVALAVMLLAFFLPPANTLLLAIGLGIFSWAAWRLPEPQNVQDFTFTVTELDTFEALEPRAKQMQRELAELRKRGARLSKRKDGYFSERSKLGKLLNPQIQQLEQELGDDQAFIVEYSLFADERKRHYSDTKSRRMALVLATIVYAVTVAVLANTSNSLVATLSLYINVYGYIAPPANAPYLWGALAIAAALSALSYLPFKALSNIVIHIKLTLRPAMDADEAIAFSSDYSAISGIGEA